MTELNLETEGTALTVTLGTGGLRALLRGCFQIFQFRASGFARLAIETSIDLFEMDPAITKQDIDEFKCKRREWVARFDEALRELFEKRLAGERRKPRRPDVDHTPESLRVLTNADTSKQSALGQAAKALLAAAPDELEALDYRVSVLFEEPPSFEVDNPFSPAYLLDAIGMTSRSLYPEPRIWRPLMERVVSDFVPAINQTYIQLNRYLAERGVVPEIGAVLRARSNLRPADDGQLLHLFSRLINEVHPSLQAWRTLDLSAAAAARYNLAPLKVNPYIGAATKSPRRPAASPIDVSGFPTIEVMMAAPRLTPVLETLDCWQRTDPMAAHLRASSDGSAGAAPVNRIPWIHAAIAAQVTDESSRNTIDVVGFLFDHILRDPSIPAEFRVVFDGLQVPILKAALIDQGFFADKNHPARRLLNDLASAAVGAHDDPDYGTSFERRAMAVVDTICADFVLDTDVFAHACRDLKNFTDDRQKQTALVMRPRIDAALAGEERDADRSRVRALIRDKLAGLDIPFDVRAFIGTVWADYLTRILQTEGSNSEAYLTAVQTMDDMLWSIRVKERSGQKARLSKMIPALVSSLRAGGVAVQVPGERMTRFLDALYELHIAAIKPLGASGKGSLNATRTSAFAMHGRKHSRNVHDFIADIVLGTWLAFDKEGTIVQARLSWVSPLRSSYIFTGRAATEVMVFTPEELAWEVSAGKATLVLEPVPLFDRAVSVTLEYLAEQKTKQDATSQQAPVDAPSPSVWDAVAMDG